MATFELNSIIKIGNYKPFRGANEVIIKKSLKNYLETCVIKVPATARLKQGLVAPAVSTETAKLFKRGDPIKVYLGYNSNVVEEFDGFIRRVNMTTPCEIECEGYAFQLRDKPFTRSWKKTTLKEVLSAVVAGTDIVLDDQIPELPFTNYSFIRESCFSALELIMKDCGKSINIWMNGKTLYAGLKYYHFTENNAQGEPDVVYKMGYNVVRDGQMKQRLAGDNKTEVEFYHRKKDGSRVTAKVGVVNSNTQQKKLQAIADLEWLQRLAKARQADENYTGFDGKITAFLSPYCEPGYKMKIIDLRYTERSGNYLVESVQTKYGRSGARREIEISFKL